MEAVEIHVRRYEGASILMCNRPHEFHLSSPYRYDRWNCPGYRRRT